MTARSHARNDELSQELEDNIAGLYLLSNNRQIFIFLIKGNKTARQIYIPCNYRTTYYYYEESGVLSLKNCSVFVDKISRDFNF